MVTAKSEVDLAVGSKELIQAVQEIEFQSSKLQLTNSEPEEKAF